MSAMELAQSPAQAVADKSPLRRIVADDVSPRHRALATVTSSPLSSTVGGGVRANGSVRNEWSSLDIPSKARSPAGSLSIDSRCDAIRQKARKMPSKDIAQVGPLAAPQYVTEKLLDGDPCVCLSVCVV